MIKNKVFLSHSSISDQIRDGIKLILIINQKSVEEASVV
jgi:hypothetical protein